VLAARAAAGEAAAFTELVRRHERKVRSFLSRVARGHGSDDLAQETFLKAWRMTSTFRGEGSYQGWLLRIAWRLFLSEARARRSDREDADTWLEAAPAADAALRLDVDRALERLEPRERAAALLCFAEGYSHQEAAQILEMPLGTLKSIVARARAQLIAFLEGNGT
jgi:RNA polymerase sigma-70 factor (ECF subfamily)